MEQKKNWLAFGHNGFKEIKGKTHSSALFECDGYGDTLLGETEDIKGQMEITIHEINEMQKIKEEYGR